MNKLWRITLDTNPEDCNLNCIMCEENSPYSNFRERLFANTGKRKRRMPIEWIDSIVREAAEMGVREIIPTTMGDPLVSTHFSKIVECAKKYGVNLNVTHNGTFPAKSVKEWAEIIVPVTNDIKISWNAAKKETAEKIMTGIDFEISKRKLVEFISERDIIYKKAGRYCSVSLQMTFMTLNIEEIPEIIEFASGIGVDRVKGHHLWTHFPETANHSLKYSSESINKWNHLIGNLPQLLTKLEKQHARKIKLENFNFIKNVEEKEIPKEYECPFLGKELWISAMGKYSPCCAPDEMRNSLGDFGFYPSRKIDDVLQSKEYRNIITNYKEQSLCKICKMRRPL